MRPLRLLLLLSVSGCSCGEDPPDTRPQTLSISTSSALPEGRVDEPYSVSLEAAGGSSQGFQWAIASGNVPQGVVLDPSGTPASALRGTPLSAGTFTFGVRVTDSRSVSAEKSFVLTIRPVDLDPLEIVTASIPSGATGTAYAASLTARNGTGAGYQWTITEGDLPPGLALGDGTPTATISGAPLQGGAFDLTVRVRDSAGNEDEQEYTLIVADTSLPLEIETSSLPNATIGVPYTGSVQARNGSGLEYAWMIESGSLPPGISLAASGTPATMLSGTPADSGSFAFSIQVRDSEGQTARKIFILVVDDEPPPIVISTQSLPPADEGQPYSATITAVNGMGGYTFSIESGDLPVGLALAANGSISGTPTADGDFAFVVRVEDGASRATQRGFTITVRPVIVPIRILTSTIPGGATAGIPYQATLEAADGFGRYGWAVTGGALPPGLVLEPNGTPSTRIIGVPAASGTFTATISVFDYNNVSDSQTYTFEVDAPEIPLEIVTVQLPSSVLCDPYGGSIAAQAGSSAGYTWEVVSGTLPTGLTLNRFGTPAATFSGQAVPGSAGSYSFTVMVTDSDGGTDTRALMLDVLDEPGGQRWAGVVGDLLLASTVEVFAVDICTPGSFTAIRVNPPGLTTGNARILTDLYSFSPLGTHMTFVGDFLTEGFNELFVATLIGTPTSRPVSAPFPASTTTIEDPRWSPDGTGLVFRSDGIVNDIFELFYVDFSDPNQPAPAVRINGPMQATGDLLTEVIRWSPDSTKVAYVADQDVEGQNDLYVVDLTAPVPTSVRVNPTLTGADVASVFFWTNDSRAIVYRADHEIDLVEELWYADVSAAPPFASIRLSGQLAPNGDVVLDEYRISPDGSRLYFLADLDVSDGNELYLVDLSQAPIFGAPQRILPPGQVTSTTEIIGSKWSPDSTRILIRGDLEIDGIDELWLLDVSGALPVAPIRLNGPLASGSDVSSIDEDWDWSPDGTKVAFIADPVVASDDELFVIDVSRPQPWIEQRVHPPLNSLRDVTNFAFSPDSRWLAFPGDIDVNDQTNIYVVDVSTPIPGAPIRLSGGDSGTDVLTTAADLYWKRDSSGVFYSSDEATNDVLEVWFVDVSGPSPSPPRRLHQAPPSTVADVDMFLVQP